MIFRALIAVLLLVGVAAAQPSGTMTHYPIPQQNDTFLPDLQTFLLGENAARFTDAFRPFVSSGGVFAPVGGLTGTPTPIVAYPGGYYVAETASITFPDASQCWVLVGSTTTGDITTFVRVPDTHWLIDCSSGVVQPPTPGGFLAVAGITTAGGAITATTDLRILTPVAGTIPLPSVGVAGGIPYFDTPTSTASTAVLEDHGMIVGGGIGGAPHSLPPLGTGQAYIGVLGADPVPTAIPTGSGTAGSEAYWTFGTNQLAGAPTVMYAEAFGMATAASGATNRGAIQSAINALPAGGGVVVLPAGVFATDTTTLTLTKPVTIAGAGLDMTFLVPSGNIAASPNSVFNVTTAHAVSFRDFGIVLDSAASSNGITISPASDTNTACPTTNVNCFSRFQRLYIRGGALGLNFVAASQWVVSSSVLIAQTTACIKIQNTVNTDQGDNAIISNQIEPSNGVSGAGILHISAGGLRIIGNKIIGGGYWGYHAAELAPSSGLNIIGNSFGGLQEQISMELNAANTGYAGVQIIGNEMGGSGVLRAIHLTTTGFPPSNGLYRVNIIGNTFQDEVTIAIEAAKLSDSVIANNTAFNLASGNAFFACTNCTRVLVTGNTWASSAVPYTVSGTGYRLVDYMGIILASLPAVDNGSQVYCTDCTFANPCAGGGTGAIAKRLNGAWRCD